jgi:T5SS/PEP-CTERM-associated repeat protein
VTVAGTSSTWANSGGLIVGEFGNGNLHITGGSTVTSGGGILGANFSFVSGTVTVDGAGSMWTNNGNLSVGDPGRGTLNILRGGTVTNVDARIGYSYTSDANGVVVVDGAGSSWTNTGDLHLGNGMMGTGAVIITTGGSVAARSFWTEGLGSGSLLVIDAGYGSTFTVGGGAGTLYNDGTVRVLAGAGPMAGAPFTPISAGTWSGSGIYQAVGGTWNASSHQFTASAVQSGAAGSQVEIDPATVQRMLLPDSTTGRSVGASFLAAGTSGKEIDVLATTMSGDPLDALQGLLGPGQSVLGAWDFAVSGDGYAAGDPAYLSFGVGAGYSHNNLQAWHYDGSHGWTNYAGSDLTYDGNYASFTVTGFSGYAVTTVPEPGTLTLLLAASLGLLWYVRRKWK